MKNLFRHLIFVLLWSQFFTLTAQADESFFLLSDAAYGSQDTAKVRLETQGMSAIGEYGGVDVYVYRVKQPLEFLQAQKNLHRIQVDGKYVGPGIGNALAAIWDNWWVDSRMAFRQWFSRDARAAVTKQSPETRTHPLQKAATPTVLNPLYQPLKAHTLVDSFRYPVHLAKVIQPPAGVKLDGSSSDFLAPKEGNIMIPLGKKAPGLYLVEVMAGKERAVTLVFVSDSIAVTKVSSQQMMVWVAERQAGKPVVDAKTVWSDGVGVLASAATDSSGLVQFQRSAPEKTYVYGEDAKGGVFVAENFYYDSEIYNTKLYAVTDRPLYRPGDLVYIKFMGRDFQNARDSIPVKAGELKMYVLDANGFPVANQTLNLTAQTGSDTRFQLPDNAVAGGYEIRFSHQGNHYGAAFRVAEYQKPHFEINVLADKRDYKTNESVSGKLQLLYPDGKPVKNAQVELTVRAQRLTMVEGDLGYSGQFALKVESSNLTTDKNGVAKFDLPAAKEPSRYILSALATDGAAYRVRATKEFLIERSAGTYLVKAERSFSAAGEAMDFAIRALPTSGLSGTLGMPVAWDWVRLENQKSDKGKLDLKLDNKSDNKLDSKQGGKFNLRFAEAGTYTVSLRDDQGNIVGATTHYVSGPGVGAPQGSIEMVFDKTQYKAGETAHALITFPQSVDQALLTLERDKVEKTSLLASSTGWIKAQRLNPNQWRVDLPVQDDFGPNITLSVVYVKGGEYVFQNLGLKVEQPKIEVAFKADKTVYAPGDKVTLDLTASIGGKAAANSMLTVGVVDEMIYVLQPEIAPDILDFFFHPRRNNVRTSASLSFIAYDLSKPPLKLALPRHNQTHQRALKVLERPRREDKDTALWQPTVMTDANGRATVSFIMPDSLTRWRITVRAQAATGTVGQQVSYVRSDKDFYVKWTSPNWLRSSDQPVASVAIFNQGNKEASVDFIANGAGLKNKRDSVTLQPGANFVKLPLNVSAGDTQLDLSLQKSGKTIDALSVPLQAVPVHWLSQRSINVPLAGKQTQLKLPPDASNLRLQFADNATTHLRRIIDDLLDYPYGCVEQTASRLIPYSLALQSVLPGETRMAEQLNQRLHSYRFRLAQMAGPEASFSWWTTPEKEGDGFLTAYAYYADWHASRALQLTLPEGHFERLIKVYETLGSKQSLWQRALILSWMQEMGLPMRSMAEALAEELGNVNPVNPGNPVAAASKKTALDSLVFGSEEGDVQQAMSMVLAAYVVQQSRGNVPAGLSARLDAAQQKVAQDGQALGQALLLLAGKRPAAEAAGILERVRAEGATIDRALTLLWTHRALGVGRDPALMARAAKIEVEGLWQSMDSLTGQKLLRWSVNGAAVGNAAGNAAAIPTSIKLVNAPPDGMNAVVQFDSREPETSRLPVSVQRNIYRLKKVDEPKPAAKPKDKNKAAASASVEAEPVPDPNSGRATFTLELLGKDDVLSTDEVYLDEVVLTLKSGSPLQYGIVEVPLPPGTSADATTWGIRLQGKEKEPQALERARYQLTPRGYAVPIESLSGTVSVRHLVRAAQTGKFAMPAARYYRMYQPEQKAFEEKARAQLEIR